MASAADQKIGFEKEGFALPFLLKQPLATSRGQRAIILLHGIGSNENDLFGFASELPENVLIIAPRAPITIDDGRYAWYQIDFSTGEPIINEMQEEHSRNLLIQFLIQIKATFNIDEIYLGGFSQGAIMSYSVGLTHP